MIFNKSNGKAVSGKKRLLGSSLEKAFGLMFRPKPQDEGWVFVFDKEKIVALHMLFVFYPIDVLWLNKDKRVVELKKNFSPFTFYTPKNLSKYVIEFAAGTIRRTKTQVGDLIEF